MSTLLSVREVSEMLGLPHLEVNRRIRRGDIQAQKLGGWTWVIKKEDAEAAMKSDWYLKRVAKQAAQTASD